MSDPSYPPEQVQSFDVVLIKKAASEFTATPEDFLRVPVQATSSLTAQFDEEVEKQSDYRVLFATPPGYLTDPERLAAERRLSAPA